MTEKCNNANDFIQLGPKVSEDGTHVGVRYRQDNSVEQVLVQPMVEGRPIPSNAAVLSLSHRQDDIYDVTDSYEPGRTGPAMVTSPAYRTGWDQVFGKNATVGQA